jgi:hypothetical protein
MVIVLNADRTTIWTSAFLVISVLELVVAYLVIRRCDSLGYGAEALAACSPDGAERNPG